MKHRFYYIYSARTDLPVCIADTFSEAVKFIGCSVAQFCRILDTDNDYDGLKVLSMTDDDDFYA